MGGGVVGVGEGGAAARLSTTLSMETSALADVMELRLRDARLALRILAPPSTSAKRACLEAPFRSTGGSRGSSEAGDTQWSWLKARVYFRKELASSESMTRSNSTLTKEVEPEGPGVLLVCSWAAHRPRPSTSMKTHPMWSLERRAVRRASACSAGRDRRKV